MFDTRTKTFHRVLKPLFLGEYAAIARRRFSGRLVCVKKIGDIRDYVRFEGMTRWTKKRALEFVAVGARELADIDWQPDDLAWVPYINPGEEGLDFDERFRLCGRDIPSHVPVVIDVRSYYEHPYIPSIKRHLTGHRLACRNISPFDSKGLFELHAQYNHCPIRVDRRPRSEQDVLLVDIHNWEDSYCHHQVLAILDHVGRNLARIDQATGVPLHVFFSMGTQLQPYRDMAEVLEKIGYGGKGARKNMPREHGNYVSVLQDRFIASAPTREDMLDILARTRLFVTFHNNLSDGMLFEAIGIPLPVMILPKALEHGAPWRIWAPQSHPVREFRFWLRSFEDYIRRRPLAHFERHLIQAKAHLWTRPLEATFDNTWDGIWRWSRQETFPAGRKRQERGRSSRPG